MKLKHLYIALGLSLLLPSCKDEEPVVNPTRDLVEIPVSFTIKLTSESKNTRSEEEEGPGIWKDETGEEINDRRHGTDFDNTINSITPVLYLASKYGSNYTIDPDYPVAELEGKTLKGTSIAQTIDPESHEPVDGSYDITGTMICSGLTPSQLLEYEDRLRLAVFINCADGDVMSPLKPAEPAQATFNHHGQPDAKIDAGSKHFHGIPMYGVTGVKFFKETVEDKEVYKVYAPTSTEQNRKKINIPILRSMAKVRVCLQTDEDGNIVQDLQEKGVELQELYISRHAVKGYVVPKGWNTVTDVTTLDNNGLCLNPFTGPTGKDDGYYNHDCTVTPQTKNNDEGVNDEAHAGDNDYYANSTELLRFYLPDTFNYTNDGDASSKEIYLRLKYTINGVMENGKAKVFTHVLWFRPQKDWPSEEGNKYELTDSNNKVYDEIKTYPTGAPWDIIRNHIYEFVIEGVEATFDLKIGVSVKKWDYHHIETEL